jgi:hypothetical protein
MFGVIAPNLPCHLTSFAIKLHQPSIHTQVLSRFAASHHARLSCLGTRQACFEHGFTFASVVSPLFGVALASATVDCAPRIPGKRPCHDDPCRVVGLNLHPFALSRWT